MPRKRKIGETRIESTQCYRTRRRVREIEEGDQSQLPVRTPEQRTDNISQKCKPDDAVVADQKKAMSSGRKDSRSKQIDVQNSQITETCNKLKIVVRKNYETGEWSAAEDNQDMQDEPRQQNCKSLKTGPSKSTTKYLLEGGSNRQTKRGTFLNQQDRRSTRSRKRNHLKSKELSSDHESRKEINDFQKFKLEPDGDTKTTCREIEKVCSAKCLECAEQTASFSDKTKCADIPKQDKVCQINDMKVPVERAYVNCNPAFQGMDSDKEVTLSNVLKTWTEKTGYADKDVYIVEMCDEEDAIISNDSEHECEIKDRVVIQDMVDIKLLPYQSPVWRKKDSDEMEEFSLGSSDPSLHEKSTAIDTSDYGILSHTVNANDVNQSCNGRDFNSPCQEIGTLTGDTEKTGYTYTAQPDTSDTEKAGHTYTAQPDTSDTEKAGNTCTAQPDTSDAASNETAVNRSTNMTETATENSACMDETTNITETATENSACTDETLEVKGKYLKETAIVKHSDINGTAVDMVTNETETVIENNIDVKETALEESTDLNEIELEQITNLNITPVKRDISITETKIDQLSLDINSSAMKKETNVYEITVEENTDLNEIELEGNTNLNITAIKNDVNIAETKLDQLSSVDGADSVCIPENIRDIEELISWTVGQTLNNSDSMKDKGSGTSETYNQQENVEDVHQLEEKSIENCDENNNCLIEVYLIDDNERNENSYKNEVIIYDNVSDVNDRVYAGNVDYDKDASMFDPCMNSHQPESQGVYVHYDGQLEDGVSDMFATDYIEQDSLEEESWLPICDAACISPLTGIRYKNVPYWDPCLVSKQEGKEQECKNGVSKDSMMQSEGKICSKRKRSSTGSKRKRSGTGSKGKSSIGGQGDRIKKGKRSSIDSQVDFTGSKRKRSRTGCKRKRSRTGIKKTENDTVNEVHCTTRMRVEETHLSHDESGMLNITCADDFQESKEVKSTHKSDNVTAAKACIDNKGLTKSNAKTVQRRRKTSVKAKRSQIKSEKCCIDSSKRIGRRKKLDLCTRIVDDLVERKKLLREMKSARYGDRPHVVRVTEDGIIIDVTQEYRQHLPYEYVSL